MSIVEEVKALEAKGYEIRLHPAVLARESELNSDDDWVFADLPGVDLLTIRKDGFVLAVEKQGDAEVEFAPEDPEDTGFVRFKNEEIPIEFRKVIEDGASVEVRGKRYRCAVRYNGWFTAFMGKQGSKEPADYSEPESDLLPIADWADMLDWYIREQDGKGKTNWGAEWELTIREGSIDIDRAWFVNVIVDADPPFDETMAFVSLDTAEQAAQVVKDALAKATSLEDLRRIVQEKGYDF